MAFKTSEKYKSVIYSGDAKHKLKLLFNGVELADADVYCESLKVTSRIIPNGSTRFSLDNFIAKEAEIILHDIDTTIIQSPVNISIGTLVDGTYEYVPIGLFVVQDLPTTDKNKTTIKLRDYAVKFDFGYNAKQLIDENGGSVTKLQILQDICNKAGVETTVTDFLGSGDAVGIYDNSITARTYISYLAEQAGAIPTIDRSGKLIFVYLKDLETVEIPLEIVEKYEDGEKYEISRIMYEDAIRKFEAGEETKDTLFLNTANPYIEFQSQIESILELNKDIPINSFKTGKIIGNPAIDAYDIIKIVDDDKEFKTLATNDLTYNGVMINTFDTQIGKEAKKENVTLTPEATFKKWAKTEIDNVEAEVRINTGNIQTVRDEMDNMYTKGQVNELVANAETGVTNTFSEAGGNNIFRNTGLWFTEQKTYQEEQTVNHLANKNYTYCTEGEMYFYNPSVDNPINPCTLGYTYQQSTTATNAVRLVDDELIEIDHTLDYKYTYTDVISDYEVNLYELDEELKFIGGYSTSWKIPKYTTLTQNTDMSITFSDKAKYLVLVCEKVYGSTSQSLTLEELKAKLDLIQLKTTKATDVSEEVYEFWDGNVLRKSNDRASNNNSMLLQKGTLWQEQEVPNGNYSISFWYKKLISQSVASVVINDKEYQLNSTDYKQFYTGEKDSESNEYIVEPIAVTSGHLKVEFKCDTNGGLEVYDLMANKGSVKLAYSQNENETTTETVNISKGITITSSNMETIFKANANGIRILTLQNEIIAYFTDKGLSTKELTVENKAQVCGTLVSEVEGQTWFTRM